MCKYGCAILGFAISLAAAPLQRTASLPQYQSASYSFTKIDARLKASTRFALAIG
jgi:hypothetical protein